MFQTFFSYESPTYDNEQYSLFPLNIIIITLFFCQIAVTLHHD